MKKAVFIRLFITLAVLGGLIFSYLKGREDVWKNEYKECSANLLEVTAWETNQPLELKDYIKARYYYLANKLPKDYVEPAKDFGPISTNVKHIAIFKGPSSGQVEYEHFLQRFELSKPGK